jgi:hypothetical protein
MNISMSLNRSFRREKMFGTGRPRPMSRHEKVNVMREAQRLRHEGSREPGRHITRADLDVLKALLWSFHNAGTGLCFPSYEAIKEAAGCARSTVHEAIKRLEAAKLLTWVHRLKRVYERVVNMFGEGTHGQRSRVLRTSNGYRFTAAPDAQSSKSENTSRTEGQVSFLSVAPPVPAKKPDVLVTSDRMQRSRQWLESRKQGK